MNASLNFQLLRPLLQCNFWQIKFLLKNVNKSYQDFTLWIIFFRSKMGSANISLTLLWRFEATCSVWSRVFLLSNDYSNRSKEKSPTALGLVPFKRKNLQTLFAICHFDQCLPDRKEQLLAQVSNIEAKCDQGRYYQLAYPRTVHGS